MAIDFKRDRVIFDETKGIEQHEIITFDFDSKVIKAEVAINGFDIKYTNGDHHILRQKIDASIGRRRRDQTDRSVNAEVSFLLQDNSSSGNIDDPFEGWVDVLVIAEVE